VARRAHRPAARRVGRLPGNHPPGNGCRRGRERLPVLRRPLTFPNPAIQPVLIHPGY
jgi:hypothetical protein